MWQSTIAPLPLHFAAHAALWQFQHEVETVTILAIEDDFQFVGPARVVGPLFAAFKSHCNTCLRVDVNLDKSSALILQAHTDVDPRAALAQFYDKIPDLKI